MANHNYQCSHRHCRKRYAFPKPIERYVRTPKGLTADLKCGACGKGNLRPTRRLLVRQRKRDTGVCRCSLVPVPHRVGRGDLTFKHHPGIYFCESYVAPEPETRQHTGEPGDDVPF